MKSSTHTHTVDIHLVIKQGVNGDIDIAFCFDTIVAYSLLVVVCVGGGRGKG